ncbi:MAG: AMIN domain-containing protein [Gallionella sp.]|nr:AMIN domain-containing protein [Gallionella sp.]
MHNIKSSVLAGWVFSGLLSAASGAYAQNSITALNAGYIGNGTTVIKIGLAQPLVNLPHTEFIISSPPRIVLEFPDTVNGLGESVLDLTEGGLHSANIIQIDGRTRFVIYLSRMFPYNIRINDSSLLIVLQGNAVDVDASRNALRLAESKQDMQQGYEAETEENAAQVTEAESAKIKTIAAHTARYEEDSFASDLDILMIQPAHPDTDWLFFHRPNKNFVLSLSGDTPSTMTELSNTPKLHVVAKPRKEVIWLTNERWQIASDGALFSPILRFESKGERLDIKPRRRSIWFGWCETFP